MKDMGSDSHLWTLLLRSSDNTSLDISLLVWTLLEELDSPPPANPLRWCQFLLLPCAPSILDSPTFPCAFYPGACRPCSPHGPFHLPPTSRDLRIRGIGPVPNTAFYLWVWAGGLFGRVSDLHIAATLAVDPPLGFLGSYPQLADRHSRTRGLAVFVLLQTWPTFHS